MSKIPSSYLLVLALICFGLILFFDISLISAFNYFAFVYLFFLLLIKLGTEIPIRELTSFVLVMQMIIAPLITYQVYNNEFGFKMEVSEDVYINQATPLVFSFIIGIYLPIIKRKQIDINNLFFNVNQVKLFNFGWYFLIFGLFSDAALTFLPMSLKFIFTIFSYFQFLGAFCLFFSNYKYKLYVVGFVYALFLLQSIGTGMFYALIVWGFFLASLFFIKYQTKFHIKLLIILSAFMAIFIIQAVKREYREIIKKEKESNKVELFYSKINEKLESKPITEDKQAIERFLERVNTGHITSKVFNHTPKKQPFSNGQELLDDIISTLMPRFLFPNKKSVGGEDNSEKFFKYTGRVLNDTTIMRIGIIGDAYLNFGLIGGCLILLILGILINLLLTSMQNYSLTYPLLILWIPIIFNYVVRMSDFIVIINSVVKILFILSLFLFVFPRLLLFEKNTN